MIKKTIYRILLTMLLSVLPNITAAMTAKEQGAIIKGYTFKGNGWQSELKCSNELYMNDTPPVDHIKLSDDKLHRAILNQLSVLERKTSLNQQQTEVKGILEKFRRFTAGDNDTIDLSNMTFMRLAGEDRCGNTLMTAYYTPTLELKRKPDDEYRYPVYRKPESAELQHLSRADIYSGKLAGKGLEIGYAKSAFDAYIAQVQGSTQAHFIDIDQYIMLGYAAKNGKAYTSLGKTMVSRGYIQPAEVSLDSIRSFLSKHKELITELLSVNESFVFFVETADVNTKPKTSSGTEAIPYTTIAVDPAIIAHGSIVLLEVPVIDNDGEICGRSYRLVIANDAGGAIKGAGHLDIYTGSKPAVGMKHYGRAWIVK